VGERDEKWVADHDSRSRDTTPAVGTRGQPGAWRRALEGAAVTLARRGWGDAAWSYLFKRDTGYATEEPVGGEVADAARRMRAAEPPAVHGPIVKKPVWSWEIPLYFWFGGIAAGSAFVALGCDLAGDPRSAARARKVSLAALAPCPPLLIGDLGRPARFLNMLRIFKPRSPMSMGSWCLTAFGNLMGGAVGADILGRPRSARAMGAGAGVLGGYLGSYTGVLLSGTAVPLWARSRLLLGPIFIATATATGAAATRLVLIAGGLPEKHPTRVALGRVETGAMFGELALSTVNERRLGRLGEPLRRGRTGLVYRTAKATAALGLSLRFRRRRAAPVAHDLASALYLLAGLGLRFAWVEAGKVSAVDHEAVALMARRQAP
jgi:hypothetical protein